ncbi:hypothetical protein HMPREF1022_01552 [Desulfovibrio sp. 6_1_46AFAA]|uniref:hypothetical protein n=1 Tax=Desulfovibrio sp. 6_1_46AFAA TaxID=665942 RepID=UPI00022372EE|nr:hypothetical protein [Desulfovibrio sp. 6_1_46AFAA]EGW51343.1 hypothetical protein HMPREF1022_01552 [Desulfovibrio sp. 6_1_46AFAA]
MNSIFSAEERDRMRQEMRQSLEEHLVSATQAAAYILISLDTEKEFSVSYGVSGVSTPSEIMTALTQGLLECGEALGVRPRLIAQALDLGSSIIRAKEVDSLQADETKVRQ